MADLLPCPFCGSTNLRHEFAGSQGFIECNECGTVGPCDERAADPICDIEAAADAWNRRPAALAADGPPAELLERHAAPVLVPGVAHTRYEFSVCDETGMEVAGGSAPTYAQALSEGRHYLAQYQQDEPRTLELRRVEVLDPDALPLPAPQGGEVEP